MLPFGHAAFAYLVYAAVTVVGTRRPPVGVALVPLVVASQLPDLIDKPLAFVGLLPSGRSLAHSLVAMVVVSLTVALVCRRLRDTVDDERVRRLVRLTPVAVVTGYASHLVADAHRALLSGRYGEAAFLFYPLVPAVHYPNDGVAPWTRLARIYGAGGLPDVQPVVAAALVAYLGARAWAFHRARGASRRR